MVLALKFATEHFGSYLLPRHFTIITVEEKFPYVLQHMDVSSRIAKWLVYPQEFDYTVMVEESTQAMLAYVLTHQHHEKKLKREVKLFPPPELKHLEEAFSLSLDGAFKRKEQKATGGIVVFNLEGQKVLEKGEALMNIGSNNEAKHAAIHLGL